MGMHSLYILGLGVELTSGQLVRERERERERESALSSKQAGLTRDRLS